MTPEQIKERIVNEIKLRAYDDQFIDRGEEREFIQIAIQLGVTVEGALAALNQVCDESGYLLESRVWKRIEERVAAAAAAGPIDRAAFDAIAGEAQAALKGKRGDRDVRALVVTVMERSGHTRVKTGWLRNWYRELKRELGVP